MKERWGVAGLCVLGAARVLFAGAALPLFNNVDEQMHFDLALKYSRGRVPVRIGLVDPEAARLIAFWGSPEFFNPPEAFADGRVPPPVWERPFAEASAAMTDRTKVWSQRVNLESNHPPVYYALAALCYAATGSIYAIRFMNALFLALTIWLSWFFSRRLFSGQPLTVWGLPMLVAVFPQDVLYGINGDALSPLVFGAAFFCALDKRPAAGLLGALAVLVKWTNLAVFAAIGPFIVSGKPARRAWAAAGAVLPVALWCAWKYGTLGELTGDAEKARAMGWTLRPVGQWWSHPLFSPAGAWFFLDSFLKTFWRGELIWHGRRLFEGPLDVFYTASSCVFLAAAGWQARRERDAAQRAAVRGALAALAAFLGILAWASVRFDFGSTHYPSRAVPFMYSGRLAFGALVPFLLLYLRGFRALTPALTDKVRLRCAAGFCVVLFAAGVYPLRAVWSSRYNWFHRPAMTSRR